MGIKCSIVLSIWIESGIDYVFNCSVLVLLIISIHGCDDNEMYNYIITLEDLLVNIVWYQTLNNLDILYI